MNLSADGFVSCWLRQLLAPSVAAPDGSCARVSGLAIWCYQCVSTHPGCGKDLSPQLYWSVACPTPWDVCVKVTETKGGKHAPTSSASGPLPVFGGRCEWTAGLCHLPAVC